MVQTITKEEAIDELIEYCLDKLIGEEDYLGQVLRYGETGYEEMSIEELEKEYFQRFDKKVTITEK